MDKLIGLISFLFVVVLVMSYFLIFGFPKFSIGTAAHKDKDVSGLVSITKDGAAPVSSGNVWMAPDTADIPKDETGKQIRYGRSLIVNTSSYLGPKGTVAKISNGMNCQNCHLEAGTKPFGNNYGAVASTYPKFRPRSRKTESVYKRMNDCFERSLNGQALDTASREMQAMKAYIDWLGKSVKKGVKPEGSGIETLAFMDRAADPEKGKALFLSKCIACHGAEGKGVPLADGTAYQYPPLWGDHSYNTGAGLYRLIPFAGYIKNNMPNGATKQYPQLSDEEAWDIAAFVNSQSRPQGNVSRDWPELSAKPVDNPFGPYSDKFAVSQHKYGPYAGIAEARKKDKDKTITKKISK